MYIFRVKYQIRHWSFYDYKNAEENLSQMAEKGWELSNIGGFFWKFKKTEPAKKRFAVLYFNESIEINSKSKGESSMLNDVYGRASWQKIMEWKQLRIFSTDEDSATPLNFDEAIRVESARDAMQKFILPGWIMGFFLMLIMALRFIIRQAERQEVFGADYGGAFFNVLACISVAMLMMMAILGYLVWLRKSRTNIKKGGISCKMGWYYSLLNVITIALLILLFIALVL